MIDSIDERGCVCACACVSACVWKERERETECGFVFYGWNGMPIIKEMEHKD